jgi:hypothetical protein
MKQDLFCFILGKTLNVLLIYVEDKSKIDNLKTADDSKAVNFVNVIEWMTIGLEQDGGIVKLDHLRRFVFFGEIELAQLVLPDSNAAAADPGFLCLGDQKSFQLVYDSAGGSLEDDQLEKTEKKSKMEVVVEKPPAFYWFQGVEDMAVWVMMPEDTIKRDIKVVLKPSHLYIKIKDQVIIDDKLWNILDSDRYVSIAILSTLTTELRWRWHRPRYKQESKQTLKMVLFKIMMCFTFTAIPNMPFHF